MDIYKCPKLKKIFKLYFTKNEHTLFYGGSRATFAITKIYKNLLI